MGFGLRDQTGPQWISRTARFADLIILRLIGEGHSPGSKAHYVSLATRPGALVLAPVACARNGTMVMAR